MDDVQRAHAAFIAQLRDGAVAHAAPVKSALVNDDEISGMDSAASFGLIRTTWTSVKAFLKTYFDTLYPAGSGTSTGTNTGDLVSGTTIKTVNGTTLLGSGDVTIAASLTVVDVSGTSQAATAGNHYVLTNVAATTVTLPASPSSGDTVAITVANSLATNVIARNGQTIMDVAEDMTIDVVSTVTLRFLNSSWRLV